ncbi:MAG: imidazole glycerol phosphate synthase subunit HisH [Candidatus Neomarinimicrobiota bacterium]
MSNTRIGIVDYGASNLRSVAKAFERLGYEAVISGSPDGIEGADALVLPGQGAARYTMEGLRARRLVEPLERFIGDGRPFFGVCMGLQVLFDFSDEEDQECLGLLPGKVRRLPAGVKVPHMGWNQVVQRAPCPLFDGIPDGSYFYFVHSYYPAPDDPSIVIGQTEYSATFCCAIARDNTVATLFHPEKSGDLGLKLYDNFVRYWVRGERWR